MVDTNNNTLQRYRHEAVRALATTYQEGRDTEHHQSYVEAVKDFSDELVRMGTSNKKIRRSVKKYADLVTRFKDEESIRLVGTLTIDSLRGMHPNDYTNFLGKLSECARVAPKTTLETISSRALEYLPRPTDTAYDAFTEICGVFGEGAVDEVREFEQAVA